MIKHAISSSLPPTEGGFDVFRKLFHDHLFDFVLPFWTRNAMDPAGGLCSCISDEGTVLNRDKWLWSQWRAVWIFSRLYRSFGFDEKWLRYAIQIADFCCRNGWDDRLQRWRLAVDFSGREINGCDSIYTDAFAIYGLTELALASGNEEYLDWASKTAEASLRYLRQPHAELPQWPYPLQAGEQTHGIPMMFSLVFWEHFKVTKNKQIGDCALEMGEKIFTQFYQRDRNFVVERIAEDGGKLAGPRGNTVVPGHVVESMWFQIHIAEEGGYPERIPLCCDLIKRHLEAGWDATYGGLHLAVAASQDAPFEWAFSDSKLWWPHTEAIYATLLAYFHTGDEVHLKWFDRIVDYSFNHYPVTEHGEWRQRLNRQGKPFTETVALPVKDPFHLPRALILCCEILDRIKRDMSPSAKNQ